METYKFRTAFILSAIVAVLAFAASFAGLFTNLYRDNTLVTAAYRGNDLVTVAVVVPLLIISLFYAKRGSQHWLLVWLGSISYMLYNYIFYIFGAAFNSVFLIYAALVGVSLWTLILSLPRLDAEAISKNYRLSTPVKWICGFMLLIPIIIGGIELSQIAEYFSSGEIPLAITQTGHPTGVIYAADLGLLMPTIVIGAIMLWKRQPWGYILGTIVMIKGVTYPLALIAMTVFSIQAGTGADPLIPFYGFFLVGSSIALGLLMKNLQNTGHHPNVVEPN